MLQDRVRHLPRAHRAADISRARPVVQRPVHRREDAVGDLSAAKAPAHHHFEREDRCNRVGDALAGDIRR